MRRRRCGRRRLVHGRCVIICSGRHGCTGDGLLVLPAYTDGAAGNQWLWAMLMNHDKAALSCLQLKFERGPTLRESEAGSSHLFEVLASRGRNLGLAAPASWLQQHGVAQAHVREASSDSEAVQAALELLGALGTPAVAQLAPPAAATAVGSSWRHDPPPQQGRQPPSLVWVVLGDTWEHMEAAAQQVSEQVSEWAWLVCSGSCAAVWCCCCCSADARV